MRAAWMHVLLAGAFFFVASNLGARTFDDSDLEGTYVFEIRMLDRYIWSGGDVTTGIGYFTADGQGTLEGLRFMESVQLTTQTFNGTYRIEADGTGTAELEVTPLPVRYDSETGREILHLTLSGTGEIFFSGRLLRDDGDFHPVAGSARLRDTAQSAADIADLLETLVDGQEELRQDHDELLAGSRASAANQERILDGLAVLSGRSEASLANQERILANQAALLERMDGLEEAVLANTEAIGRLEERFDGLLAELETLGTRQCEAIRLLLTPQGLRMSDCCGEPLGFPAGKDAQSCGASNRLTPAPVPAPPRVDR